MGEVLLIGGALDGKRIEDPCSPWHEEVVQSISASDYRRLIGTRSSGSIPIKTVREGYERHVWVAHDSVHGTIEAVVYLRQGMGPGEAMLRLVADYKSRE